MASPVRLLQPGEPAPWFKVAALEGNPSFVFDTVAGRPILLLLMGSAADPNIANALATIASNRSYFDDQRASFFGVTVDQQDAAQGRIRPQIPGIRYFLDYDGAVSRAFGAIEIEDGNVRYRPHWLVLDRQLRLAGRFELANGEAAMACLKNQRSIHDNSSWAPVLEIPGVFEPALCADLIKLYEDRGGRESGFMREVHGKTVMLHDHSHKRRADFDIDDPELCSILQARIHQRVKPMIQRAFQFEVTRMERYIIACYDGESGGHFRPHRDNTTKGTAHRRFAVTINLNAEDYDGGDLRFPEFGMRAYRAPTGGAIVFSCSLLHEVLPMTRGRRFAFLPFLYDEAASAIRQQNNAFLGDDVPQYQEEPKS
jgi:predicted 2-oxoglutarate/Fe(II)-dependent dioxygenase YbiX/peroxiredoxin